MTPQEYQRERARLSLGLIGALRPLAELLRPSPTPAQWSGWVQAAYPAVYRGRVEQWELARQFYLEERARFGYTDPVDVPLRSYAPEALDTGLREIVKPRIDDLDEDDEDGMPTVLVNEVLDTADRHANAAGRDAIVDAARHDRRALGYARVTVGAENCAFCLMLVSRGPVYRSEDAALLRDGTGEPYHNRCDCLAIPVFDRDDWPGREEYLEMEAAWQEHGGDLKSWRKYISSLDADSGGQDADD